MPGPGHPGSPGVDRIPVTSGGTASLDGKIVRRRVWVARGVQ